MNYRCRREGRSATSASSPRTTSINKTMIIVTKDATRGFKKGIPAKDCKIPIDQDAAQVIAINKTRYRWDTGRHMKQIWTRETRRKDARKIEEACWYGEGRNILGRNRKANSGSRKRRICLCR
jgi:hypothetical protein